VDWEYVPPEEFAEPLVWTGPSVECKLEHPALESTCFGEQFFPDSVPYRTDCEHRVFYWRARLPDVTPPPERWIGLCATTHELAPLVHGESHSPTLSQTCNDESELVVDGTIVGDAKTALVSGYAQPTVELRHVSEDCAEFVVEDDPVLVPAGERERIELSERAVETDAGTPVSTTPELVVRYPGQRTVYHPALQGEYTLFPSFGLCLDDVSRPLVVPTAWDELDHEALAEEIGIDTAEQPYPERVLWQAFAYAAFEPNGTGSVELTQFPSGEIAVRTEN